MIIQVFVGIPYKETPPLLPTHWHRTIHQGKKFAGKRLPSPHPTTQEIQDSVQELLAEITNNYPSGTNLYSKIVIFPEILSGIMTS
ncbi:hypothetical protein [Chlamydiifrater volucris]|uniref:hypothetical protein n=1 Tax=Chlamydiifrater volucris TaxID=2681470 RepID=UPI001BD13107|nr:hypothetical protein [Chlamydiifrater volucris]